MRASVREGGREGEREGERDWRHLAGHAFDGVELGVHHLALACQSFVKAILLLLPLRIRRVARLGLIEHEIDLVTRHQ